MRSCEGHPGLSVRHDCIEDLNLTITEAAEILGVTRQTLNNLVNGKSGISPEMAIRLDKRSVVARKPGYAWKWPTTSRRPAGTRTRLKSSGFSEGRWPSRAREATRTGQRSRARRGGSRRPRKHIGHATPPDRLRQPTRPDQTYTAQSPPVRPQSWTSTAALIGPSTESKNAPEKTHLRAARLFATPRAPRVGPCRS